MCRMAASARSTLLRHAMRLIKRARINLHLHVLPIWHTRRVPGYHNREKHILPITA